MRNNVMVLLAACIIAPFIAGAAFAAADYKSAESGFSPDSGFNVSGTPFALDCPAGTLLVGLALATTTGFDVVDHISIACAAVVRRPGPKWNGNESWPNGEVSSTNGQLLCPRDSFVGLVQVLLAKSQLPELAISGLVVTCRAADSNATVVATPKLVPNYPDTPSRTVRCNAGDAGRGVFGHTQQQFVISLGLHCVSNPPAFVSTVDKVKKNKFEPKLNVKSNKFHPSP